MDKKKEVSIFLVILHCSCAVLWSITLFRDLSYGYRDVLHILNAIVWNVSAVLLVLAYLKSKKGTE